jgi:hypothetical protein
MRVIVTTNRRQMEFLKQYRFVISIVLIVTSLILLRTFNQGNFRYDAVRWAEPSLSGSNILTEDEVKSLDGEKLIIDLGNNADVSKRFNESTRIIDPVSILEKENIRIMRGNKGPVILASGDISVSARIWMVLSEMGLKNLFILQPENR